MKRTIKVFILVLSMLVAFSCTENKKVSGELLDRADELFKAKDYEQALTAYEAAATAAKSESNNSVLTEAYSQIARCHIIGKNLDEARKWLARAGEIANANEPEGWSRFLGVRGRLEWQEVAVGKGELTPAVKKSADTFKEMYDYCLSNKLYSRAVDAAHMVAIVGEPGERIKWGEEGIKAAEQGSLTEWLGPLWNNHGWNLDEMGEYDAALEALLNARKYHYLGNNELAKLIADWSVGHAYRMAGKLDTSLSWMIEVNERAEKRYQNDSTAENAEWTGFSNKELGEIALAEANYNEALDYFSKAQSRLKEAGMPEWDKKGFSELENKIADLKMRLQ